ncbi:hypothetical protein [Aliarcobacter butzleri]|uniref:hypothetical protein n=1 Tax=Aliarcobacter butzleri TaxID=28197 RepID=UPI00263D6718|nr:hypothetical protein [Aliarcobacter butzleri]MDN5095465.1 hypothetical protein [Aliarcobacter butzleri]
MFIRIILFLILLHELLSANNQKCIVPDIILETVKITENETSNPYLIRTNEDINSFYNIVDKFPRRTTEDKNVIDCLNLQNCVNILNTLIQNKITNLDLGLFQINYNSFKYPLNSYFDKDKSYKNVCSIIKEKIKMNKGKWNWTVVASYHSITPKYNNIYKKRLIDNYIKLTSNNQIINTHIQTTISHSENILVVE